MILGGHGPGERGHLVHGVMDAGADDDLRARGRAGGGVGVGEPAGGDAGDDVLPEIPGNARPITSSA